MANLLDRLQAADSMTHQRYLIALLLLVFGLMSSSDVTWLPSVIPSSENDAWMARWFLFAYVAAIVPTGWISDKMGPRVSLTLFVIVGSAVMLFFDTATTFNLQIGFVTLLAVSRSITLPGATQAFSRWSTASSRGLAQGFLHATTRASLVLAFLFVEVAARRYTGQSVLVAVACLLIAWALLWWNYFRDTPDDHRRVDDVEFEHIQLSIEDAAAPNLANLSDAQVMTSANVWLAMLQAFACGTTMFVTLYWLPAQIKTSWSADQRAWIVWPYGCAAAALVLSGGSVTTLYRRGFFRGSRRLPAMIGFGVSALSLLFCTQFDPMDHSWWFVACFTSIIVGIEFTVPPAWAFCMDVAGPRAGTVSSLIYLMTCSGFATGVLTMQRMEDIRSRFSFLATATDVQAYFVFASVANVAGLIVWLLMNPTREMKPLPRLAIGLRVVLIAGLTLTALAVIAYACKPIDFPTP